jgi:hypothetical protein
MPRPNSAAQHSTVVEEVHLASDPGLELRFISGVLGLASGAEFCAGVMTLHAKIGPVSMSSLEGAT